jgi:hypothetical protein
MVRCFYILNTIMHPFILTGIRAGLRGKSIQAILILGLLLIGAAHLSGNFSPRNTGQGDYCYGELNLKKGRRRETKFAQH